MSDESHLPEHPHWDPETGASTGDLRENDPNAPGFTAQDPLFRSHFQHANRLVDRAYEDVRPAFRLGYAAAADPQYAGRGFEEVEKDLENGWLNVRTRGGDWQTVRDYARRAFEQGRRTGFVDVAAEPPAGTTRSHQRATFSDPVPGGIDPTSPESPEQTLAFQHENDHDPEWGQGNDGGDSAGDVYDSSTGERLPRGEPGTQGDRDTSASA